MNEMQPRVVMKYSAKGGPVGGTVGKQEVGRAEGKVKQKAVQNGGVDEVDLVHTTVARTVHREFRVEQWQGKAETF